MRKSILVYPCFMCSEIQIRSKDLLELMKKKESTYANIEGCSESYENMAMHIVGHYYDGREMHKYTSTHK